MTAVIEKLAKKGRRSFGFLASILFGVLSLSDVAPAPAEPNAANGDRDFVTVSESQFLDGAGKPLLLHGINIINKSQAEGYTKDIEQSDFAAIHGWGMNCVRLGILWDGLEPEPGKISEEYLDRISHIVGWAKAEGLYVLLDMHQDLFSVKFSDGAPAWATLDDGKPYKPTAVWSDAYYKSDAVQTALDHFWEDSPGPDGVGLQEHYQRVWRRVAERFRVEPAVLGYDLMNEPFPGHDNARSRLAMLAKLVELLPARLGEKAPSPIQLTTLAGTPEGRKQITEWFGDMELFPALLDAGAPVMQDFERKRLMPMYAGVRKSIREVDPSHIIFFEPATSANIGVPSVMTPLLDDHGSRDAQQAYAPHGYDIVTDTPQSGTRSSNARIDLIFSRHAEKARELKMPLLIGEWGAYYEDASAADAARYAADKLDTLQCGDTYWAYRRTLGQSPLLKPIKRRTHETAR